MIVPDYKITQDNQYVIITLFIKYFKISDIEYFIYNNNFRFYLKPYHLNLNFKNLLSEDTPIFEQDYNLNILVIKIKKLKEGEYFEDLVIMNNIRNNKKIEKRENKIEVIDIDFNIKIEKDYDKNYKSKCNYGFNNNYYDYLKYKPEEANILFEINPENIPINKRWKLKEEIECNKFDEEHYLYDYNDPDNNISNILTHKLCFIINDKVKIYLTDIDNNTNLSEILSDNEQKYFNYIKKKELIIDEYYLKYIDCIIIDILYSYLYTLRIFNYENNPEISWSINKISSLLSNNIIKSNIKKQIISLYKRSLIYPLYRNYKICEIVIKDLLDILKLGKIGILKIFIYIKCIFDINKPYDILNYLYIEDLIWYFLHQLSNNDINNLYNNITNINITKNDLYLDIIELEEEDNELKI